MSQGRWVSQREEVSEGGRGGEERGREVERERGGDRKRETRRQPETETEKEKQKRERDSEGIFIFLNIAEVSHRYHFDIYKDKR